MEGVHGSVDKALDVAACVIRYGVLRMSYICVPYFLCGMMDVIVGVLLP